MEGMIIDLGYDPQMLDLFRIGTCFILVLIGFALTDWGGDESPKDEGPYD